MYNNNNNNDNKGNNNNNDNNNNNNNDNKSNICIVHECDILCTSVKPNQCSGMHRSINIWPLHCNIEYIWTGNTIFYANHIIAWQVLAEKRVKI